MAPRGTSNRHHPYREVPYLLNSQPGKLHHTPLAFVHRGGMPQAENTMAAFQRAVDLGYRYIETDVRTTACGTLVAFHDETLDNITTGTGPITDHTWEELSTVRVVGPKEQRSDSPDHPGEPLALFDEMLAAFPDTYFNVDLKDSEAVEPFCAIVEKHQAHHRVLAASFNDARRQRVNTTLSRPVATSGGWRAIALIVLLGPMGFMRRITSRFANIDCVQVPLRSGPVHILTEAFVSRCQRAGLQVHVWTIDDPDQMHQLLDMGVDGIMTDDAQALAEVMTERGVWPQR